MNPLNSSETFTMSTAHHHTPRPSAAASSTLYFIGTGAEATELVQRGLALLSAHMNKVDAFQRKHGADAVSKFRDGHIHALAYECEHEDAISRRPGLRYLDTEATGDTRYQLFTPDPRNQAGKAIAAEAAAIGGFNFSDWLVTALQARRTRPVANPASPTGRGVSVSCAGTVKGQLLLQVPVDPKAPFVGPAWLRQVKQSEYLAAQGL